MMTSIGDLARGLVLQRQTGLLKAEVARLSSELASGRVADPGRAVRGDMGLLAALDSAVARNAATRGAVADAARLTGMMQTALETVDRAAQGLAEALPSLGPSPSPQTVENTGRDARARFGAVVGALNARDGARSLFAGAATGGPALSGADAMFASLQGAVAASGAASPEAVADAVRAWFEDPAGFATLGYRGSPSGIGPVPLGSTGTTTIDVTAADPALRQTLAGLAIAAFAAEPGSAALRAGLLAEAQLTLAGAVAARAEMRGDLGRIEGRLQEGEVALGAEAAALTTARSGLVEADPYAAATALETAQTRIETLYAMTARVSRLTLADFL